MNSIYVMNNFKAVYEYVHPQTNNSVQSGWFRNPLKKILYYTQINIGV